MYKQRWRWIWKHDWKGMGSKTGGWSGKVGCGHSWRKHVTHWSVRLQRWCHHLFPLLQRPSQRQRAFLPFHFLPFLKNQFLQVVINIVDIVLVCLGSSKKVLKSESFRNDKFHFYNLKAEWFKIKVSAGLVPDKGYPCFTDGTYWRLTRWWRGYASLL